MPKVIDLDTLTRSDVLLVTFRGIRTAVDRERLVELLEREQDYWRSLSAPSGTPLQPAASPPAAEPASADGSHPASERFVFDASQVPRETVSHASLSTRIKKVYTYSRSGKSLRPAHISLLKEMIQTFDWNIPKHPNTKLERQLVEILSWKGVSEDFRSVVMAFLDRYLKARQKPQKAG